MSQNSNPNQLFQFDSPGKSNIRTSTVISTNRKKLSHAIGSKGKRINEEQNQPRKALITTLFSKNQLIKQLKSTNQQLFQQKMKQFSENMLTDEYIKKIHESTIKLEMLQKISMQAYNNNLKLSQQHAKILKKKQSLLKQLHQKRQNNHKLRREIDKQSYQKQSDIGQYVSQNYQYNFINQKQQQQLKQLQRQYQSTLIGLQNKTQKLTFLKQQLKQQQNLNQQVRLEYNYIENFVQKNMLYIKILKLQLNPLTKLGFSSSKEGLKIQTGLDKENTFWDANKNKKLYFQEIIYFMTIHLYKDWKRILRKLSFQSPQYQTLFGLNSKPELVQNLQQLMELNNQKKSLKNYPILIAIGSPSYDLYTITINRIVQHFKNFNSGIIKIKNVQIRQAYEQNFDELKIQYILQNQQLIKTYQLYRIKEFTKESISKYVNRNERMTAIYVEIPAYHSRNEHNQYEQLYQWFKRQRG